ncbi:hypothetical protein Egran_01279 [Elaphomyces granulatus]|uniref:Plasmid pRiA4b Orf3-like domain-containing protein n=1 Tax=Elaphomyces granulatus TaxID=519963 RepID=A0A232M3H0_9EURO|nr:hypothetical protein Egran_01279 [Elaphomyces granulatus]
MPRAQRKQWTVYRAQPYNRSRGPLMMDAYNDFAEDLVRKRPKSTQPEADYLFSIRLVGSKKPTIMRILLIPSTFTFEQFNDVIQIAFGWTNYHGHYFTVSMLPKEDEGFFFGVERDERNEKDWTLADFYDGEVYPDGVDVSYTYDMGDWWDHSIDFLGRADPNLRRTAGIPSGVKVACLGGEGHPGAEDCGGAAGWENLKACFKKRSDPYDRKDWYKNECMNGEESLDPWKWSKDEVNAKLSEFEW